MRGPWWNFTVIKCVCIWHWPLFLPPFPGTWRKVGEHRTWKFRYSRFWVPKKILSPWPFTTIKWTLLLGRNFCNEHMIGVSLGMISSIIIPNNCYHLQCSFTALSHLGRILSSWRSLSSNGGYYRSIYFPFLGSFKILLESHSFRFAKLPLSKGNWLEKVASESLPHI